MHIVQQLTPFTCGLACLESVTTDFGKAVVQSVFLTKYRMELYHDLQDKGDFGATSDVRLASIWKDLGYKGAWEMHSDVAHVRDQIFRKLSTDQAILILSNMNLRGWHCIRLEKVLDDQTIAAMVPNFPGPTSVDQLTFADLVKWQYRFAVINK